MADASFGESGERIRAHAFSVCFAPNMNVYNTGTKNKVSKVANPSPAMIVIDILTKNASDSSGIKPRMVVAAAIATGRKRLTVARIAPKDSLPSAICLSISSIRTIAFLISSQ